MAGRLLIISFGPSQLLQQIALVQQLGRLGDVHGVVSYVNGNPQIVAFEEQVCRIFEFRYLGAIADFRENIPVFAFDSVSKSLDTLFRRNLVAKARRWLFDERLEQSCLGCEVVVAFRRNLISDHLLLQVLEPCRVHMIPDGFYMTMDRNLIKWVFARLAGLRRFKGFQQAGLYLPDFFPEATRRKWNPAGKLETEARMSVLHRVRSGFPEVERYLEEVREKGPVTMVLWQNLFPKFVRDKQVLLEFFHGLLKTEGGLGQNLLLVKPHPRNTSAEIEELQQFFPAQLGHRVRMLPGSLCAFPVEMLSAPGFPRRIAGIASTGIWSVCQSPETEVALYGCRRFPKRLNREIFRFARLLNIIPKMI